MALSQALPGSMRKGQAAILCHLCEFEPKLKWKCLECELMMCQRCRDRVHPKFASAEDHTIVNIKELGQDNTDFEPKPALSRIKCRIHEALNCCLYCKTCEMLVCKTCIAKAHIKHDFREISDEYRIKVEKVQLQQTDLEMRIQRLTMRKEELEKIKTTEQLNYDNLKQDILDDKNDLENEIKKHTNILFKDLDERRESFLKSIKNEENHFEKSRSQFREQIEAINDSLEPNNAEDIFLVSYSLFKSPDTNVSAPKISLKGLPRLKHGERSKIPLILGKLEDVTFQYNTGLNVESEFETDLEDITCVVSCPDNSLWICDSYSDSMKKIEQNGKNLHVKTDLSQIRVFDAEILRSGNMLLSDGSCNLKWIRADSTDIKNSAFTVFPLKTIGIHLTSNNKVIMGAVDEYVIPAAGPRQVIVMDQTGHREKVFQYDKNDQPLFTYPYKITSDSKGNIAVIDWVSNDNEGRVVILNYEGEVRNVYTGLPDINNEDSPFNPKGITTTPSDNFVVADMDNHSLHILNSDGEIITFYNTQEEGILLPHSLSFSTTGKLYIGCCSFSESGEKAKLFAVGGFNF